MIGNDVVDLRDPDAAPTWRTPAFDARVFSPAERARIAVSTDAVRERWLIWTAKEAAYKLARKHDDASAFIPRRFEVMPRPGLRARVRWGASSFECQWVSEQSFVHALCFLPSADEPGWVGFERVDAGEVDEPCPEALSRAARRLAQQEIARVLAVPEGALEIRKSNRIPFLCLRGQRLAGDLSLSHHGAMVAFAWSREPVRCVPPGPRRVSASTLPSTLPSTLQREGNPS
jgi:hypothetical protein